MNSCILMAEIIQDPQLRYTSDTQTPIAEMLVQFPGAREEDPPSTLKVVGWGNLAQEIQERYHQGDRVVIEGRLMMNTVDRQEGFKEKRAELTVQRIHAIATDGSVSSSTTAASSRQATPSQPMATATVKPASASPAAKATKAAAKAAPDPAEFDDIPF